MGEFTILSVLDFPPSTKRHLGLVYTGKVMSFNQVAWPMASRSQGDGTSAFSTTAIGPSEYVSTQIIQYCGQSCGIVVLQKTMGCT